MSWSVSETFERIRPHLPEGLDETAVARCARIAGCLPDEAAAHYLELRLGSGQDIDFLTAIRQKSVVSSLVARLGPKPSQTWATNLAILQDWAGEGGVLARAPFLYLEYDAGQDFVEHQPEPSLSFAVEKDYPTRGTRDLRGTTADEAELGLAAFRRQLPATMREACMATLERCYAALPPNGAIPHAPVMRTRRPVAAKPYVILPRDAVFHYLDAIGWPGSRRALADLLASYYAPFQRSIYLDVTVTDCVESRLGIVTSQFQRAEADFSTLDWWRLPPELAHFRVALAHWPGCTEEYLSGQRVWMRRWLDTKAVLRGSEVEYKAYLGFGASPPPLFG